MCFHRHEQFYAFQLKILHVVKICPGRFDSRDSKHDHIREHQDLKTSIGIFHYG
jgi:hypothetical protein